MGSKFDNLVHVSKEEKTQRYREVNHVKTEADTGVMLPQPRIPGASRSQKKQGQFAP